VQLNCLLDGMQAPAAAVCLMKCTPKRPLHNTVEAI